MTAIALSTTTQDSRSRGGKVLESLAGKVGAQIIECLGEYPRFRMIKIQYRKRVTSQHLVNGRGVFKPEMIGVWLDVETAYFDSLHVAVELFDLWNSAPWEYEVVAAEAVRSNLPKGTTVHLRHGVYEVGAEKPSAGYWF